MYIDIESYPMSNSTCTISFFRNDLQKTHLPLGKCPVKHCSAKIEIVPYQKYSLPFCPEHGIRIHQSGFVYFNGPSDSDKIIATKRNLQFHGDYYISNFFKQGNKMESGRLCYESSEDAVSYNVFSELLANGDALRKLMAHITNGTVNEEPNLYLWGGKINLRNGSFQEYRPLAKVRGHLEGDIKRFKTEPDIMLVVPKKAVVCIEAKFGSKNPIAKEKEHIDGEKPKRKTALIERYCRKNTLVDCDELFIDLCNMQGLFYEQLFRNIIFAASMAHIESAERWYVVNLRNQHNMNIKRNMPESLPVMRSVRAMLKPKYKKRFMHLTWEDIYEKVVRDNRGLNNLGWYLKNKSLRCSRAFNVF